MDWLSRINEIRETEPLPAEHSAFAGVRYERFELGKMDRRWCSDCGRDRPPGDFRTGALTCAECADRRVRRRRGMGGRRGKLFGEEV